MAPAGELWIQITVPLLLIVIMASMGLELALADFRRVVTMPKPVLVGLTGQLIGLPILGLAFAEWSGFPPALAVGVVIITACPGGAPSNIFTYLAGANIALSVSLTALSSVLTPITIPLWVNAGLERFQHDGADIRLPIAETFVQLVVLTLVPVGVGMLVRARRPELADRLRPGLRRIMAVLFLVAVALIVSLQWEVLVRDMTVAAPGALVLVILALGLAFFVATISGLERRDAFTISVEVGLQNGALGTMIAVNLLDRPDLVIFPGAYALLAFIPVGLWTISYRMVSGR